jgi:hypothetical protein
MSTEDFGAESFTEADRAYTAQRPERSGDGNAYQWAAAMMPA